MITKQERKRLKEIFGSEYSQTVLRQVNKDGLLSKHGVPFTVDMIRQVFNGLNHEAIEASIYKAAKAAKNKKKLEEAKRKSILKSA